MSAPSPDAQQQVDSPRWRRLCGWLSKFIFRFLGMTVGFGLVIGILSIWLTSSKGIIPSDSPLAGLLTWWPLLLSVGGCLFLVAIVAKVLSREPGRSASTSRLQQNREQMLKRLRHSYEELISQFLQGTVQQELGLVNRLDTVQNTTNFLLRTLNQPERMLPAGTSIVDVYEQTAHELLILGEPGAGKSTLLYQLGLHLVEQAVQDETSPLPVLLPLSTWAVKRLPLQEWIGEQLSSPLYDVPRQISRQWIQNKQILPLLDGLDEMKDSARAACIAAINSYHHEHLLPLVVCSGSAEYTTAAAHERLILQSAVVVQPFTDPQIDDVLTQGGKPLDALRRELKKNPALHDLARSPLWMNILLLTYQGTTMSKLPRAQSALQQQIFTTYVERMQCKGSNKHYSHAQTVTWLCWLARQMRMRNQTVFSLELLQPDWLSTRGRSFYRWSVTPLIGLVFGLLGGTLVGLVGGLVGVLVGGLLTGLVGVLVGGLLFGRQDSIELAEILIWSWRKFRTGLVRGLLPGLVGGPLFGLLGGMLPGIVFGLVAVLFFGLIEGFSTKQFADRLHLSSNEGIQRSALNGLFFGLLFALVGGLFFALIKGPLAGLVGGLVNGLFFGLAFGLLAVVQHYILRFWLWRTRVFPWYAERFLEEARRQHLLRRVGNGYSFIHRLLLDYFADLEPTGSEPAPPTPPATIHAPLPTNTP